MSAGTNRWSLVLAPLGVGVVVILFWQGLVTVFDVPSYLVPGPWLVAKTLVADWSLLSASLLVTLSIALLALLPRWFWAWQRPLCSCKAVRSR